MFVAPRFRISATMCRYASLNFAGPTSRPPLYGALQGFQSPFTSVPYSTTSAEPNFRAASAHAARSPSNSPAMMRSSVKLGSVTSG